jgi:uncharacterized protein (DUF433 family)
MTPIITSHIWLDDRGVAWIDDTNIKVIEVAKESRGGASPQQIVDDHPGCYTLAQVHAALAYYHDHQDAFDAEIARQATEYDRLRTASLSSPMRDRLRAMGKLP